MLCERKLWLFCFWIVRLGDWIICESCSLISIVIRSQELRFVYITDFLRFNRIRINRSQPVITNSAIVSFWKWTQSQLSIICMDTIHRIASKMFGTKKLIHQLPRRASRCWQSQLPYIRERSEFSSNQINVRSLSNPVLYRCQTRDSVGLFARNFAVLIS